MDELFLLLKLSVVGGILCIDRIFVQTQVCRPVISSTLIGLVLNDISTGLLIGALLELIWIDQSPIGTMVPPNDTLTAVLIPACCILSGHKLGQPPGRELIVLSILLILPAAILAKKLEIYNYGRNDNLARKALAYADEGDLSGVERMHLAGLTRMFFLNTILLMIILPVGYCVLVWIYPIVPVRIMRAFTYIYYFIPILGVGVALNTIHLKRMLPAFCCIFIILITLMKFLK